MTRGEQVSSVQATHNIYKIRKDGGYGEIMVGLSKLLDEMVLDVYKGDDLVCRGVDKAVVNLLTNNDNPKVAYSPLTIEVSVDLNTLCGLLSYPSSGKW